MTTDDCKKDKSKPISSNKMFPKVPDNTTKDTSCRLMTDKEKEKICTKNNRQWLDNKCLVPLNKPKLESYKIKFNESIIKVSINDYPVQFLSIIYT